MSDNEIRRNCNTCKLGLFSRCDGLKNNEEYQEICKEKFDILKDHKFKENFICDNYKSRYIEYPIEVFKINTDNSKSSYRSNQIGKFARVSPCGEEYKGKTYLGLYLGDLPISNHISYRDDTKELKVSFHNNPAIFVFDLNKIVYGCESWWGIIESEEDLKEITKDDIDNVWYVKALKALGGQEQ